MRRYKPKRTFFVRKRCIVHGIRHNHFGLKDSRIQLRKREDYAITVLRCGDNISGHRRTAQVFPLRNARFVEKFFEEHPFISFRLLAVRIHNRESFPLHLFEVVKASTLAKVVAGLQQPMKVE